MKTVPSNYRKIIYNNKEYYIVEEFNDNFAILHDEDMCFFVKIIDNNIYADNKLFNKNHTLFTKNFKIFVDDMDYKKLMSSNGHYFSEFPLKEIINICNRKKKLSKLLSK